jgi:hypothetical protein
MALLKNIKGEYNYHFNWIDETGMTVGFNDVWASNKREAKKKAKAMESPARDYDWGRMTGMFVDIKSMRRATRELADQMDRLGWMMSC